MTTGIPALLEPIQARLDAATPGPWEMRQCSPCTERGRLEVNIWDKDGNFLIANWCDDDPYEPADAEFIANAPTDTARLLAAVQAVVALHEPERGNLIGPYCAHCISPIDGGPEPWPCPTVSAVEAALRAADV